MKLLPSLLLITSFVTPASRPSPALAGIAHVAFRVSDVAKSREFYQKLGFEQAFEFHDPGRPPVSYMKVNDTQFIELYQRKDDTEPLGLMHVCYEASDLGAVQKEYVQREIKAPEPRKARAGNMLMVLHDPEDKTVEFTQYMPGSLHYEDRGKHLAEPRVGSHLARATIAVGDLAAERSFYAGKLGFEDLGGKGAVRLRILGAAADEIELDASSPAKTRIALSVPNVERTEKELRRRGLAVQKDREGVALTDPDGAMVLFAPNGSRAH
jgi:catechol 2,3-dioxygenase-like lactoylglutathione lyase family enzyme